MNKILLTIALSTIGIAANADNYKFLTVNNFNGEKKSISLTDLKLTFPNNEMVAQNNTDTYHFSINDIQKLTLTENVTGIDETKKLIEEKAYYNNGNLTTIAPIGTTIHVYSLSGNKVTQYRQNSNIQQSNLQLISGIYIVKMSEKAAKVIVQ